MVLGWPWRFVYAKGPVFEKVSVQFDWTLKGFQLWGIKSYFFSLYNTIEEKTSLYYSWQNIRRNCYLYHQLTQKERKIRYFSKYLAPNRFTLKITCFRLYVNRLHTPQLVHGLYLKRSSPYQNDYHLTKI